MNKKFGYRKEDIVFPYGLFLLVPIIAAFFLLDLTVNALPTKDSFLIGTFIFMWSLVALLFFPVLLWILNGLGTVIVLTDAGITKKDLFREVVLKWGEIARVEKKRLYEGSYSRYSPELPGDLMICGADGRKMQIYRVLQRLDEKGEGIAEFEQEIYKRIDINKRSDVRKYNRNQLRLGVGGGILVIIAALAIGYNPPSLNVGLFGVLLSLLGIRGTVALMILLGCFLAGASAYKLIRSSRRTDSESDKSST